MYYIVYPLLYLLSLLPWRVLYFISDGLYGLAYYIIGYRKDVVMKNLSIAFPKKTEKERVRIAKQFYHNLVDAFIETIKLLSLSDRSLAKRYSSNHEVVDAFYDTGRNVQYHSGHFFNVEVINLGESRKGKFPFVAVYMPISNKTFDKIIYRLRSRYGTQLVPAMDFKTKFHQYVAGRYGLALAADQNPGNPLAAHWIKFFDRYTPFVTGPEKGAKRHNNIVIVANFYRVKRGYFRTDFELLTTEPNDYGPGQLTKAYIAYLERAIRERPSNYLWSHRRWKFEFDEEKYGELVVE